MAVSHVGPYNASLERCLSKPDFIETFYRDFVAGSDDVRALFAGTNMARQQALLAEILTMLGLAMLGNEEALSNLERAARTHGKNHLDIRPDLYGVFRSALLRTAAEFDPEWDPVVGTSWRVVIDHAIEYMTHPSFTNA
jgi:hemoglobin-like flavoprotein